MRSVVGSLSLFPKNKNNNSQNRSVSVFPETVMHVFKSKKILVPGSSSQLGV